MKKEITHNDIIELDSYIKNRKDIKSKISKIKSKRRIPVGPHATFYFESYDTMLFQIQEMIYIERGGKEQLDDELKAYNPLVPKGKELVSTLMFEIPDEDKRKIFLNKIGGIENKIFIQVGNSKKIYAKPEGDTDRTNQEGKASSVHFVHFYFEENLIEKFKEKDSKVLIGFDHENYEHLSFLSSETIEILCKDFD